MKDGSFARSVLALVVGLGIPGWASATNLVKNPAFTGGLTPWVGAPSTTLTFDTKDEAGATSSGSAHVAESGDSIGTVSQCLAIDPSVHYRFRADVLFPTGPISAYATAYLYGYATSDCSGSSLSPTGLILNAFVPQRDDWVTIRNENAFVNDSRFHSVILYLGIYKQGTSGTSGTIAANWDNVVFEPGNATGPCVPDNQDLCLSDFRFRVHVDWATSQNSDAAHSVQLSGDAGVFTFFDPGNVELQLKVLDACSFASRYWVFTSGTTNVGVGITVTDTKTGQIKTYSNPLNQNFVPILDTNAFATCP